MIATLLPYILKNYVESDKLQPQIFSSNNYPKNNDLSTAMLKKRSYHSTICLTINTLSMYASRTKIISALLATNYNKSYQVTPIIAKINNTHFHSKSHRLPRISKTLPISKK
jgi:hypothetical protein